MTRWTVVAAGMLAAVTGCAAVHSALHPTVRPYDMVQRIVTDKKLPPQEVSRKDLLLESVPVDVPAVGPGGSYKYPIILHEVKDGQLCITTQREVSGGRGEQEAAAEVLAAVQDSPLVVKTYASLDEITKDTPWPGPTMPAKAAIESSEKQPDQCQDEINHRQCYAFVLVQANLCVPMVPIPKTANFLVLASVAAGKDTDNNRMVIWKLSPPSDSDPTPAGAAAPATGESTEASDASEPPERAVPPGKARPARRADHAETETLPPVGAPVAGNVIEVMTAAGNFTTFLGLVEAAGLTAQLESAGTYTVFAPTDHAFARKPHYFLPGLRKDQVALERLVRAHVAVTTYDGAALGSAHSVDVMTLSSRKQVRSSGGKPKLGVTPLTDETATTNGVLWSMDAVMEN